MNPTQVALLRALRAAAALDPMGPAVDCGRCETAGACASCLPPMPQVDPHARAVDVVGYDLRPLDADALCDAIGLD